MQIESMERSERITKQGDLLIGCCVDIEDYSKAAAAGFDYVELKGSLLSQLDDDEYLRWRAIVESGPIPCLGLNASIVPEVKICGPAFSQEKIRRYGDQLCSRAAGLGVRWIGIGSPASRDYTEGDDLEGAWGQAEEFLRILCASARAYEIRILWEPVNPGESTFGYESRESAGHVALLREQGESNLGMVCDLYHVIYKRENCDVIREIAPLTEHVHLASVTDQRRGFVSERDIPLLGEMLKTLYASGCRTFSSEAFSGDILRDGTACVSLLRALLK